MLMLCDLEGNYRLYTSSSGGQRKYAEYIILIGKFSEKQLNRIRIEDLNIKRVPGKEAVEMGSGCLCC